MSVSAFKRGVINTFLGTVYLNGIAFVTSLLTARLLGPKGRGEVGLLLVYAQMAWWLAGLGLSRGHIFQLGRRADDETASKVLTQSILFSVAMGVVTAAVMSLLVGTILAESDSRTLTAGIIFFATIPLMMVSDQVMNIFLGLKEYRLFNIKRVLMPTLYSLSIVALYAAERLTAANLILAQSLNVVLELAVSLALLATRLNLRWNFDRRLFKESFSFGIKSYPVDIAETANQNIDQLIVAPWLGTHNFGLLGHGLRAKRRKASFWMRKFHQLRARGNPTVALVAIARKMIVAIYYILRDHVHYKELGADYVPHDQPEKRAKRLVRQLNALGFAVQLAPVPSEP